MWMCLCGTIFNNKNTFWQKKKKKETVKKDVVAPGHFVLVA